METSVPSSVERQASSRHHAADTVDRTGPRKFFHGYADGLQAARGGHATDGLTGLSL